MVGFGIAAGALVEEDEMVLEMLLQHFGLGETCAHAHPRVRLAGGCLTREAGRAGSSARDSPAGRPTMCAASCARRPSHIRRLECDMDNQ